MVCQSREEREYNAAGREAEHGDADDHGGEVVRDGNGVDAG